MPELTHEWLETDGLGGFASGTVGGARTRRYHALLLTALNPPAGRAVLVNGFDAWVATPAGCFALSSQRYAPGVTHPDGAGRIVEFTHEPWPRWVFALPDDTRVTQEIFVPHGRPAVVVTWRLLGGAAGVSLRVRPFLSGRDYHALHRENPDFNFTAGEQPSHIVWHPYSGLPGVVSLSNAAYRHDPQWYRNFEYDEERARGLDCIEDLASPGELTWDLSQGEAVWLLTAGGPEPAAAGRNPVESRMKRLRAAEAKRRRQFPTPLHRAADAYIVARHSLAPVVNSPASEDAGSAGMASSPPPSVMGEGAPASTCAKTIIAGYPWFTDWGRDTFIALRGLCLATGRLEDARGILLSWAGAVSLGMMPNRFADHGEQPEYNSVDASLWFIVAVHDFLAAARACEFAVTAEERSRLAAAVEAILEGYAGGTRHQIRADRDGLLACGEPGVQLTWMDAKVGDWVVTPRIGKPVEVQALWINALGIGVQFNARWQALFAQAHAAFGARLWNEQRQCLFDVVDCDHVAGRNDAALRPNQIFAVGGLPLALLEGARARLVVEAVEDRLLTPLGLRSLAPVEPGYAPRYGGGVRERDGAYHQGTVWPWLLGPFVEAWLRVHGGSAARRREARERFLRPLHAHLATAGLGHVSEIAEPEAPHVPCGCPWQAWSLGELLRLEHLVQAEPPVPARPRSRAPSPRTEELAAA